MATATKNNLNFAQLGLDTAQLKTLDKQGYSQATPVQQQAIPYLLAGDDLLVQAQTGSGKTAAFSLPALAQTDFDIPHAQVLVITPTRELAIQVAQAMQNYAQHISGFRIATIYGGQDYQIQLRALKKSPQIIVGTPGRLLDQIKRGSLKLNDIRLLVLDEADEMLKMGFIDDIQFILQKLPKAHQSALFSATMPRAMHKIVERYFKKARHIKVANNNLQKNKIEQCYIQLHHKHKTEALARIIEAETIQSAIIFCRTKQATEEVALLLQQKGYAIAALNGDMPQTQREKVIARLRNHSLKMLIATDVAARGIDIAHLSHVINYDMPFDVESYIHRIGRTARAGRSGKAILFVTPKEKGLLREIERVTQQSIQAMQAPTREQMATQRAQRLSNTVHGIIEKSKQLPAYREIIDTIQQQHQCDPADIAAALVYLLQQNNPLPEQEQLPSARDGATGANRRGRDRYSNRGRSRQSNADNSRRRGNGEDRKRRKHAADSRRGGHSQAASTRAGNKAHTKAATTRQASSRPKPRVRARKSTSPY